MLACQLVQQQKIRLRRHRLLQFFLIGPLGNFPGTEMREMLG